MEAFLMLGVGLFLTVRLRGAQFRLLREAVRSLRGGAKRADASGISPFQAVCTALAGTLGTGNIAGVAGAISLGGPGAVFWMWLAAILGMATKYAEVALAVHYRRKNACGEWVGGPMYYIESGLGRRFRPFSLLFCVAGMLASLGVGNAAQVNTLAEILAAASGARGVHLGVGAAAAVIAGMMLHGGMRRVARASEKLIPWMSVVYVTGMLCVVFVHAERIPTAFAQILMGAFTPRALGGAAAGISIRQAVRVGISRGVFTHEAGMGSSPIAHAGAQTQGPVQQGALGVFEVFADTLVMCTLTAVGILCSGCAVPYGEAAGAEITLQALSTVFGRGAASVLLSVCLGVFALSTLIAWSFYGLRCAEYMGGQQVAKIYRAAFVLVAFVGAVAKMDAVWQASAFLNMIMALLNLPAVLALSGEVAKLTKK